MRAYKIGANGFGLAEGGEFEILMLKFTIMFNRIPNAQPCNSAPLLANPCCALGFYFVLLNVQIMAFSFVALKIVLCFSFGSGE